MATRHPIYPRFLQDAFDHSARLINFLIALEARTTHRARKRWLVGRAAEVECMVEAVADDWGRGAMSDANAVRSILGHIQIMHRGLAVQFGELAPPCCVHALVATVTPVSLLAVTPAVPSAVLRSNDLETTWDVDEKDLLDATYVPGSD